MVAVGVIGRNAFCGAPTRGPWPRLAITIGIRAPWFSLTIAFPQISGVKV